jgi:hypothetical protein
MAQNLKGEVHIRPPHCPLHGVAMTYRTNRLDAQYARVFEQEADRLWRAVYAFAQDREIAQDAVAEAFAQCIRRGEAVQSPERWIWRAAFRIAAGELEADCSFWPQAFSPSGEGLAGIEGPLDEGGTRPAANRVVVVDVETRRQLFRSEPIPGARQVAWEEDGRLLVLARSESGTVSVYRCDVSAGRCGEVWNVDTDAERYTVWLVPRAPSAAADSSPPEGRITVEPSSGPIGTKVRITGSCQAWPGQRETLVSGEVQHHGSSMAFGSVTVGFVRADAFKVTFSVPGRAGELQATGGGPISVGDRIVFVTSPAGFCASEPFTITE